MAKTITIARSLAFKWQRILLFSIRLTRPSLVEGHDHTPYDEAIHLRSLQRHNPVLYQLALATTLPKDKSPGKSSLTHFSTYPFTSDGWLGLCFFRSVIPFDPQIRALHRTPPETK